MKNVLAVLVFLAAASAHAASKFEVIGEGTSTKAAEFIKIDIELESECHTSALDARKSVDGLTEQALAALKAFAANIPEQLQVSPGANSQQIKTAYINDKSVVICDERHAWNSSTVIQFRLDNLQNLAALQDSLLRLNVAPPPTGAINMSRLHLSLSRPTPGVFAATWDLMSDLALQRAQANALRQVKVLMQTNPNVVIELTKVTVAKNASGQAIYDRVDNEGDTAGIGLGSVSVKIAREFTYKVGP